MPTIAAEKMPPIVPIVIVAAAAIIDADGRVLLAQRPQNKNMGGLWEFPGGKVEKNETPENALIRELREELAINTEESCLAPLTFVSHRYDDFHILLMLYVCRKWQGNPTPQENNPITWVRPQKLKDYPMPAADKPLVAMLLDWL